MQVGRLEPVGVDDAQAADAGAGEVLQHRNAEASRAHHEHGGGAQSSLALGADFTQRDLARVVRRGHVHVGVNRVLVFMSVCAGHRASLAVHPARIAVDVVFLLPDGHAMFDFIDDEAAGAKRFVAVRGAHAHPHGDVAKRQRAHAVHAGGARDAKLRARFFDDARAFLFRELGERFVFQARDRVAFVVVAHPAFEGRETAAALVAHFALQGDGVERTRAEAKWIHPPATGGMNTTASPAFKRLRPLAEFGVDGHAQHLRWQRERISRAQLGVQLARIACARRQGFVAAARLLAQQCVVLHANCSFRRGTFRHG